MKAKLRALAKLGALSPRLYSQLQHEYYALTLDYDVQFKRRWTESSPHRELLALISRGEARYRMLLRSFVPFADRLASIPLRSPDASEPSWENRWLPPLDAISLYGLLSLRQPRVYLEIGSGFSTLFARRAITDQALKARLVSIDPEPRAAIDAICDHIERRRMEDVDEALFNQLTSGDILFFDGSHRCLANSDVTVFFLEVLPHLPPNVLVGIHDVFLPYDYQTSFLGRFYSEQYILGAWLLADHGQGLEITLPMAYLAATGVGSSELQPILNKLPPASPDASTFWTITR